MNLNDDSFSLLVCLAVLSARKKDNNGNALTVNAIANNINSTSTFGYHFDSSNALSTLHTARQILRAIFATRAMDNASRIAITNSCNSNVVVALYIGAMLSLQLAQHIADRILLCNGEFDDLLNVVLNSLQQHAIKGNSVLTTHSKHAIKTCLLALATLKASLIQASGDSLSSSMSDAMLFMWASNAAAAVWHVEQQQQEQEQKQQQAAQCLI